MTVGLCWRILSACKQRDVTAVQDALYVVAGILATAEEMNEVYRVACVLEEGGGLHRIELLQYHSCDGVWNKTV